MAHILIGRYRSLTEAEAIVQDLVEQGFARSQMTLATPHAAAPASAHLGLQSWSTGFLYTSEKFWAPGHLPLVV